MDAGRALEVGDRGVEPSGAELEEAHRAVGPVLDGHVSRGRRQLDRGLEMLARLLLPSERRLHPGQRDEGIREQPGLLALTRQVGAVPGVADRVHPAARPERQLGAHGQGEGHEPRARSGRARSRSSRRPGAGRSEKRSAHMRPLATYSATPNHSWRIPTPSIIDDEALELGEGPRLVALGEVGHGERERRGEMAEADAAGQPDGFLRPPSDDSRMRPVLSAASDACASRIAARAGSRCRISFAAWNSSSRSDGSDWESATGTPVLQPDVGPPERVGGERQRVVERGHRSRRLATAPERVARVDETARPLARRPARARPRAPARHRQLRTHPAPGRHGRVLQRSGRTLVGARGRGGQVPGPPVEVARTAKRRRQHAVRLAARVLRGELVDDRPQQRVHEDAPGSRARRPGGRRGPRRAPRSPTPTLRHATDSTPTSPPASAAAIIEQRACALGELRHPPREGTLHAVARRKRVREGLATRRAVARSASGPTR